MIKAYFRGLVKRADLTDFAVGEDYKWQRGGAAALAALIGSKALGAGWGTATALSALAGTGAYNMHNYLGKKEQAPAPKPEPKSAPTNQFEHQMTESAQASQAMAPQQQQQQAGPAKRKQQADKHLTREQQNAKILERLKSVQYMSPRNLKKAQQRQASARLQAWRIQRDKHKEQAKKNMAEYDRLHARNMRIAEMQRAAYLINARRHNALLLIQELKKAQGDKLKQAQILHIHAGPRAAEYHKKLVDAASQGFQYTLPKDVDPEIIKWVKSFPDDYPHLYEAVLRHERNQKKTRQNKTKQRQAVIE